MERLKDLVRVVGLFALRMLTPAALLWMVWQRERPGGPPAQERGLLLVLAGLFVLRWAEVEELKARVRELEDPSLERWVRERVAKNRKAAP